MCLKYFNSNNCSGSVLAIKLAALHITSRSSGGYFLLSVLYFPSSVLCLPSSVLGLALLVLCLPSSVLLYFLHQYCVFLRLYCVSLRLYCVFLRLYCVFLRQYRATGDQTHSNCTRVATSRIQILPAAWLHPGKFLSILFMLHATGSHAGTICKRLAATLVQFVYNWRPLRYNLNATGCQSHTIFACDWRLVQCKATSFLKARIKK
jgi:hypothetical protein